MEPARKDRLSLSEYNQLEEQEQQRYEYHQGEVFAMAGATTDVAATDVGDPKHGAIAGNAIGLLRSALLDKDCTVFTSDVKFYLEAEDRSCYPDVSVVCGPPQRSEKDMRALTNPVLLVEVLSETTEGYDRVSTAGETKFRYYSTMPTFLEYILIDQDSWNVETRSGETRSGETRYRPSPNERWQLELFSGEDTEIPLRSLGITLLMAELYRKAEGL